MIIRKKFSLRNKHIVRNCDSRRCKFNEHAHKYEVEVLIESTGLDNGYMLMDFGLFKNTIGPFIKSFDNACSLWEKDDPEYVEYSKRDNPRVVTMKYNPSAESISLVMFHVIDKILENTEFHNNEKHPRLHSVRVHETETGWAETFRSDMEWAKISLSDVSFNDTIIQSWSDPDMWNKLVNQIPFVNSVVHQQVVLPITTGVELELV